MLSRQHSQRLGQRAVLGASYTRLWSATALCALGDGTRKVAAPLLVASLTRNPVLVAGATVAGQLPWLLFGVFAGAIVDRVDRRKLMVFTDVARLLLLAILAATIADARANLVLVYLVVFACGVGETLRETAATATTPRVVPIESLDRANGRLINAQVSGTELLGPPLGGYLFGVAAALPFLLNGAALVAAVVLVLSLPAMGTGHRAGPDVRSNLMRDISTGIVWLGRHRSLRAIAAMGALFALADGAWYAILVLYTEHVLHLPAHAYGLLLTIGGLGGVVGGFMAGRLAQWIGQSWVLLSSLLAAAVAQAAMYLTTDAVVAAAALTVSSFAFAVWNVVSMTLRQSLTPPELQGRVLGNYRVLLMGAEPVGALLGGLAAASFGLRAPLLLGIPLLLGATCLGYFALGVRATDAT